jgi:GNAT superfamily N-acetyltransferase
METTIRKAEARDADALATLVRGLQLFPWLDDEAPEATQARVARHLAAALADTSHTVLVAEDEGGLQGYVAVHWLPYLILAGPEGYVSELFLGEAARGRGVGARLLEAVRREATQRGCVRLMLLNRRTRESYRRGFYPKQGWHERDDMANFVLPLAPSRP